MNELLIKIEKLDDSELAYLFEYLVELINTRKEENDKSETFRSEREFNNKFPSKFYVCTKCGKLTTDRYYCTACKNQSTNFIYRDKGYQYTIIDRGITEEIFIPIELLKEQEGNENGEKTNLKD